MSLKKIEIEGFKSFPNRTVVDFDKGFTCIVGPNGCGKSNISDAIRWVLGEKSAKQVRGNTMKDVIFSGADHKKEMGYAEVPLYFDNTDRRFKYSGDEFSITRKIFRSRSENYYYINGKQQKLSEIVELFRDTGAGKSGFSIVGQGKIAEIINSKNSDRRLIFDEAASVAHIKAEKKKTIDNLKDVESRLVIKNEKAAALSEYLIELEQDVEKAKMFNQLQSELQSERLNYFVHIYDTSEESKSKYMKEISEQEEYINAKTNNLEKLKREVANFDEETETINLEIERKHAVREKISVDQAHLSGELKVHQNTINSVTDTLKKAEKDVQTTDSSLKTLRNNLKVDEDELSEKSTEKAQLDIKCANLSAKCDVLTASVEETEEKIKFLNDARLSGADQLSEYLSSKASAEREVKLLTDNLNSADEDYAKQEASIKEIDKQVSVNDSALHACSSDLSKANESKKIFGSKKNESTLTRSNLAKDLESMQSDLATKKIEMENLALRLKDERGYSRVTTSVLARAKEDPSFARNLLGAVGDLYTVAPEYEDAISAALGGAVNHVITPDAEKSKFVLDYVRNLHQGRLVCQPISEVSGEELSFEYRRFLKDPAVVGVAADLIEYDERCEGIYRKLLGRFIVVKDYDSGLRIWRESKRGFKIVTLAGDYFDVSGSIAGGDNKSDTDVKYANAKKAYETLLNTFNNTRKSYDNFLNLEKQYEEKFNKQREVADELRMKAIELQAKADGLKKDKEAALQTLTLIAARKATLKEKLAKANEEILNAESSKSKAAGERVNIDDLIKSENNKKENLKKELEKTTQEARDADVERGKCIERINALTSAIERLRKEISEKETLLTVLQSDVDDLNKRLQELIANKPEPIHSEEQEKQIKEIDEQIKVLNDRRTELSVKRVENDKQRELINQQIQIATGQKTAAETKMQSVDSELEDWKTAIYEDYAMTYEDAVEYKRPDFDKNKAKSQIGKLKAAISRLGEVNQTAETTYKAKKAEYDELSIDLNDLIKGKSDLEGLLERTTNEIETKFTKAFDAINDNFQSTFSDLFGGGKAELYLTESEIEGEDPGVDIDVTLPGKSRKPLSLLSGGEQTLTAIAILFAILKYKGSPFVVLDEVESALDEVNCIKFAKYLRQFAKISRFIVITHKKPTMNEGDVLYGVTMMEPGVSNILTVSMADAIELAKQEEGE